MLKKTFKSILKFYTQSNCLMAAKLTQFNKL